MAKRLTEEQFKQKLKVVHGDLITLESPYRGLRSTHVFRHAQLGIWETQASTVLAGSSHPAQTQERRANTNILRYGHSAPAQNPEIKERIKRTNRQRYGGNAPACSQTVKAKGEQTCLQRYGVRNIFQSAHVREQNQERFLMNRECILAKKTRTNLERYGSASPFGCREVRRRSRSALLRRYGTAGLHADAIRARRAATNLTRYGHENVFGCKNVANQIHLKRALRQGRFTSAAEQDILKIVRQLDPAAEKRLLPDRNGGLWEFDIVSEKFGIAIEVNGCYWHSPDRSGSKVHTYTHWLKTQVGVYNKLRVMHVWDIDWVNDADQTKTKILRTVTQATTMEPEPIREHRIGCVVRIEAGSWITNQTIISRLPQQFYETEMQIAVDLADGLDTSVLERNGWTVFFHTPPKCRYFNASTKRWMPTTMSWSGKRRGLYRVWDCGALIYRYIKR